MDFVDKIGYVFGTEFHFFYVGTVWDKYSKINKIQNKN